ncbi:FAD-dependent oxidoreductase [Candidatus Parcubacteria bacterium]|nr:FAD-dependent oxidoreductase [Candidatus Parcubacteria bacterium]
MTYDLIIIGAGPAGVAAAVYASRQKLNMLIVSKDIGGQVAKKAVDIENYPGFEKISGPELVDLYKKQLKANELEVTLDEVLEIQKPENTFLVKTKSGKTQEAISVIITSGATSRLINVPGEEQFSGKGVSYCSLCDGPVFKNKVVAVIGGGNNGFESALFLSNYVSKVYILEYGAKVNADSENQELVARQPNIEIITNAKVAKIEGKVFVESISYEDMSGVSPSVIPAQAGIQGDGENTGSQVKPGMTTGVEKKLEVKGVFVEIGYLPATSFVNGLVELNEKNEIIFDPKTLETKTPGLFSAGDCNVSKYKQIVMASGEGAKAALSAYEYIKKHK